MNQGNENMLAFPVQDAFFVIQNEKEIQEIDEIELTPVISIQETDDDITITGYLLLAGKYIGKQEGSANPFMNKDSPEAPGYIDSVKFNPFALEPVDYTEEEVPLITFSHRTPVHIRIPHERVDNIKDVYATISAFDYDIQSSRKLTITAELALNGITQYMSPLAPEPEEAEEEITHRQEESRINSSGINAEWLVAGDVFNLTEQAKEPETKVDNISDTRVEQEEEEISEAEPVEAKAETVEVKAEAVETKAAVEVKAEAVEAKADTVEVKAEPIETKAAAAVEVKAEGIEARTEAVEAKAEALEVKTEAAMAKHAIKEVKAEEKIEESPAEEANSPSASAAADVEKKQDQTAEEEQESFRGESREEEENPIAEAVEEEQEPEEKNREEVKVAITLKGTKSDPVTVHPSTLFSPRSSEQDSRQEGPSPAYSTESRNETENPSTEEEQQPSKDRDSALYLTTFMGQEETYTRLKMCIAQSDETLDAIAERYSVSPTDIAQANGLHTNVTIAKGQVLYIPVRS
jgi:stage VI sporulation protein D